MNHVLNAPTTKQNQRHFGKIRNCRNISVTIVYTRGLVRRRSIHYRNLQSIVHKHRWSLLQVLHPGTAVPDQYGKFSACRLFSPNPIQ